MKSLGQKEFARIGVIGLILTVLVVLVAQNYDKVAFFSSRLAYSGYFGDTGGLKVGDRVQVAGVAVGAVETVEIDGPKVLVTFTANGFDLADKTRLAIKTETVLGTKFLSVTPGGTRRLGSKSVIPLSQTSTPYLLTDALGDLSTTISDLDKPQVTAALDTLRDTLDKTGPNLGFALDGVSRFSDTIASRDETIQSLLSNAESVTGVLSKRSQQVNRLILDGNALFSALDSRRQAVDVLLGNITAVTRQLQGLINENEAQLKPSLDELNGALAILDRHRADLTQTTAGLQKYATSLGESVASGPFFSSYVSNLLPGQFLQPFIDAAFGDQGIDLKDLGKPTFPIKCGDNTPVGTAPPGSTTPITPEQCPGTKLPTTDGG